MTAVCSRFLPSVERTKTAVIQSSPSFTVGVCLTQPRKRCQAEICSRRFFLSERESAVAPKQTGWGLAILRSVARQPDDWLGALPGAPFKLIFTSRAIKSTLPHQCSLGAHKTVQRSSEKRHADDEKYRQDVRPVNGRAPFRRSARGNDGAAVSGGRSTLRHSRFGPIPPVFLSGQQE